MIGQGLGLVLRLAMIVVLARLISPEQFGIVAMVTVVTGLCEAFNSGGFVTATIQSPQMSRPQLSQMFWINLAVSFALGFGCAVLGPALAAFYNEPKLVAVAIVAGLALFISGAGAQHSAILQREMRYLTVSSIEFASLVANVVVSIGFALAGAGYWALVLGTLASSIVWSAALWQQSGFMPNAPKWGGVSVGSLVRMGVVVSLNSFVMYIAYNTEKMLLGRFWGAAALGVYGRAYQLINVPTATINAGVYAVALAGLSRVQEDAERFRAYFLKGYALAVSLTVPVTLACALFAGDIVNIMLGPEWNEAIEIFRLLTPT
ncbi:MAG: lipopolysaccharide biosynthesis protein, partial [Caulobacterales bacterium]